MPAIFLMRHGQAESHAESDSARSLTDYGKGYTLQIGNQLSNILDKHDYERPRILHSPYRRAAETAEVIAAAIQGQFNEQEKPSYLMSEDYALRNVALETATPDTPAQTCFDSLDMYTEGSLMLISHMPLIAALASFIEHGNVIDAHPFQTSEIRAYAFDHWIGGGGNLKFRLA